MTHSMVDSDLVANPKSDPTLNSQSDAPMDTRLGKAVIRGTPLLVGTALASGCAYVGLNDPESRQMFPECGFYLLTGMYCPGCGMTRATHNLLTLNFFKAIQFNALLVFAIPVLVYLYVWWVTWAYSGKELPRLKMSKKATYVLIGLVILFVVGRNFPGPVAEFFARDRV